jgi:3-mercaptopyruvate sulfurtransferase SseA
MQASQSYFTLKYLGYDARMYDGSFSEWSNAKDSEVQK